jgi:aminocarboxymuconate-semialdehyde decarboxylase
MPAMVGITVPPVVPAGSFECDPLRSIVRDALAHDLPVLVHPMQQCAPGLQHHYLRNLVGNPVESAVGIASLLLTGLAEELAGIRIGFVHGAGCAPLLLGRWDHGWRARADVRSDSSRLPSDLFREHVYLDLLTHDAPTAAFVASKAGADRVFLGSDYPWDMGDGDPVAAALAAGADLDRLTVNAQAFLGLGSSR